LFESEHARVVCACGDCAGASDNGRFRALSERVVRLDDLQLTDADWSSLAIPVGLAFIVRASRGQVIAKYPSAAGVLESSIDDAAWARIVERNPVLERLAPDIEALLVHRLAQPHEHFIISIADGYRLAGLMRSRRAGLLGSQADVGPFLDELRARADSNGESSCRS
jgi:hypothetical protein